MAQVLPFLNQDAHILQHYGPWLSTACPQDTHPFELKMWIQRNAVIGREDVESTCTVRFELCFLLKCCEFLCSSRGLFLPLFLGAKARQVCLYPSLRLNFRGQRITALTEERKIPKICPLADNF